MAHSGQRTIASKVQPYLIYLSLCDEYLHSFEAKTLGSVWILHPLPSHSTLHVLALAWDLAGTLYFPQRSWSGWMMWRERTALHRRTSQCSKRVHLDLFSWQFAMKTSECPSAVVDGESLYFHIYLRSPCHRWFSRMLSRWLVHVWLMKPSPPNVTPLRNNGFKYCLIKENQWLISHHISSSRVKMSLQLPPGTHHPSSASRAGHSRGSLGFGNVSRMMFLFFCRVYKTHIPTLQYQLHDRIQYHIHHNHR